MLHLGHQIGGMETPVPTKYQITRSSFALRLPKKGMGAENHEGLWNMSWRRFSTELNNKAVRTKDGWEGTWLQRGKSKWKGKNRNSLEAISVAERFREQYLNNGRKGIQVPFQFLWCKKEVLVDQGNHRLLRHWSLQSKKSLNFFLY